MSYTYDHPRPSVTVDSVVLKYQKSKIEILLIKRKSDPFKNQWALPGGFLDMDETPEEGVKRELKEETGLEISETFPIKVFGKPDRDPRGRVISIPFFAIIREGDDQVKGDSDASEARWFHIHDLPKPLSFDHGEIIEETLKIVKEKLQMYMINQVAFFDLSLNETKDINNLLTV